MTHSPHQPCSGIERITMSKNSRIIVVRYDSDRGVFMAHCGKVEAEDHDLELSLLKVAKKLNKQLDDCRISIPKASDIYR